MTIDVFGCADEAQDVLSLFDSPGLKYSGPFDGFESIPVEEYDAFIYTSAFDGLPNVILEALGAGLPVIAPDVGGISEAVMTGETGFLVPDEGDDQKLVNHYVAAVLSLYKDVRTAERLGSAAKYLIATRHRKSVFARRISEVFRLKTKVNASVDQKHPT